MQLLQLFILCSQYSDQAHFICFQLIYTPVLTGKIFLLSNLKYPIQQHQRIIQIQCWISNDAIDVAVRLVITAKSHIGAKGNVYCLIGFFVL